MRKIYLEVDVKSFSYKVLDKKFLKEKAVNFKNSCLSFVEKDIHVKNEFESRKNIVKKCENEEIDVFWAPISQTYEEYEKLLPAEVSQAWAELILYLTNCITKTIDELIVKGDRYYVEVYVVE
jgi:hypothetical protein